MFIDGKKWNEKVPLKHEMSDCQVMRWTFTVSDSGWGCDMQSHDLLLTGPKCDVSVQNSVNGVCSLFITFQSEHEDSEGIGKGVNTAREVGGDA